MITYYLPDSPDWAEGNNLSLRLALERGNMEKAL